MSSSATGVGMPICFLGAVLLILTQKSSQKFGDVLGIMSRGAEKKVAKKPSFPYLRCLQRIVSTLYLIFLKNNLKFNAEKLSIPSFLCIFAKELRI